MTFQLETAAHPERSAPCRDRSRHPGRRPRQGDHPARRAEPGASGALPHRRIPRLREIHPGPAVLGSAGDRAAPVRYLPGEPQSGGLQGDGHDRRRAADAGRREAAPSDAPGPGAAIPCAAFFLSGSPDLLFGFDSDVAKRNIVGVAAAYPDIAQRACPAQVRAGSHPASRPASGYTAPGRCPAA